VQEPAAALANHLQDVVRQHADELLTRDAVRHLLDELRRASPAVVDELIPSQMRLAEVQQVLQLLLREQVPIRQLGTILETLGDLAPRTKNPIELADRVRQRLGRTICGRLQGSDQRMYVVTLDSAWDEPLERAAQRTADGLSSGLTLNEIDTLCAATAREIQKLARMHRPAVVLVHPAMRSVVRQLTAASLPRLAVLSYSEIPRDTRIESVGLIRDHLPPANSDDVLPASTSARQAA
jgi:flagellar biosynthesis protein FlhA